MRFSFFFALEIGKKEIQLLRLLRFVFRLLFLEIQGAISIYVGDVGDRAFATGCMKFVFLITVFVITSTNHAN